MSYEKKKYVLRKLEFNTLTSVANSTIILDVTRAVMYRSKTSWTAGNVGKNSRISMISRYFLPEEWMKKHLYKFVFWWEGSGRKCQCCSGLFFASEENNALFTRVDRTGERKTQGENSVAAVVTIRIHYLVVWGAHAIDTSVFNGQLKRSRHIA